MVHLCCNIQAITGSNPHKIGDSAVKTPYAFHEFQTQCRLSTKLFASSSNRLHNFLSKYNTKSALKHSLYKPGISRSRPLFMLGSEHAYTHVQQNSSAPDPHQDIDPQNTTCALTAWCHSCAASMVRSLCLYAVCAILDALAFAYNEVIFYWCALLVSLTLVICCLPCVCTVLITQICVGIVLYLYWLNIFNLFQRPHFQCAHTWPCHPTLYSH